MLQMKGQDKSLKSPINEVEIDNLSKKEFRVILVKMLQNLEIRMEKMQKHLTRF